MQGHAKSKTLTWPALLAAMALHASATPAHAQLTQQDLSALTNACRNASLSFTQATATLAASGWRPSSNARSKSRAIKHISAGIHYRSDKPWKKRYRSSTENMPRTLGQRVTKNETASSISDSAIFVRASGFDGYLFVGEDHVSDAKSGALKVRGRTCYAALPAGPVVDALKLLGKPGRLERINLPRGTIRAGGYPYMTQGFVKTLPASGLGFRPDATEFLTIELRH